MNAYAFGDWYTARTPTEERFAKALNERLYAQAGIAFADADVHEVPDQTPLIIKSVTTVALQLLKRHRNIAYADETGRVPPSIPAVLPRGPCGPAGHGPRGHGSLIRQARWTARAIDEAARQGRLLSVPNPSFPPSCSPTAGPKTKPSNRAMRGTCTPSLTGWRPPSGGMCNWKTFRRGCGSSSASGS